MKTTKVLFSGIFAISLLAGCTNEEAFDAIEEKETEHVAEVSAEQQEREQYALNIEKKSY